MFLRKFYKAEVTRFQKASVNFYLISLLAYSIGSPFNMIDYFNHSFTDFIILDTAAFIIIYAAFFLYLKDRITFRSNSLIFVYTLLIDLSISMWLYDRYDDNTTGNILLNTFMYSINISVAGLCVSRRHSFFTAGMYIVINGPLLFLTDSTFINHNAVFILFLIIAYSFALAEFLKVLERSFNEELAFHEKLYQKDQELAVQKNKFLSLELETKKKKLIAKAMFLVSYEENNSDFIKRLDEVRSGMKISDQKRLDKIIAMHRVDHRKKYWEEFEKSFIEIHEEFYKNLSSKYPSLSNSELRLAALIHLGLSSKQIADLLSNTPESVDVARSRLRSKMNLDPNSSLRASLNCLVS
jgi:DNA-binding CsgD family transcriptional regulator